MQNRRNVPSSIQHNVNTIHKSDPTTYFSLPSSLPSVSPTPLERGTIEFFPSWERWFKKFRKPLRKDKRRKKATSGIRVIGDRFNYGRRFRGQCAGYERHRSIEPASGDRVLTWGTWLVDARPPEIIQAPRKKPVMLNVVAPGKLILTLQSIPPFVVESIFALTLVILLAVPLILRFQHTLVRVSFINEDLRPAFDLSRVSLTGFLSGNWYCSVGGWNGDIKFFAIRE